ncbi:MAG: efflux transporter outer membrane subunit, partial [Acidobacteria bacterium]|nr:efflux transporter outer membrane subunit [Acidobacteriota bacterium]
MKLRILLVMLLATALSACLTGKNYKRPTAPAPPQYRGAPETTEPAISLADTNWPALFQDERLTALVTAALAQNYDLRIAAARVLQARAQLGVTRASQLPTFDANGQPTSNRTSAIGANKFVPRDADTAVEFTQTGFALAWELDVWGRLRRLTEAARAQYLASEEVRRGVVTTLISDVTSNYLSLRELDAELEIARQTKAIAEAGLELTTLRLRQGVTTRLDVRQAEQFLYTTTRQLASVTRQIEQTENLLSLLAARNPGDIARGKTLAELAAPASIPAGLPSSLLERRPDIRAAEQQLIAANARIGAARAAYFPQIGLTALFGVQSRALSDLFTGPARTWTFAPVTTVPIFNANRPRSNVQLIEALQQEALIS